jgi:hypothetical protein
MRGAGKTFSESMRTLDEIRTEIEGLTERRAELLHALARGHDVVLAAEHQELERRIAALWDEQRAARAQRRWGDRDEIIKRARAEERLERAA